MAPDSDKPFLVTLDNTTLRVTGTAFNLRVDAGEMEVEVSEGSVELEYDDEVLPVTAKQCGVAKLGTKPVVRPAPNLNRHAWRTGHLTFENVPVEEVLAVLHNNWRTEVELPTNCHFDVSATWNTTDPAEIVEALAKLGGTTAQPRGANAYAISGPCSQ